MTVCKPFHQHSWIWALFLVCLTSSSVGFASSPSSTRPFWTSKTSDGWGFSDPQTQCPQNSVMSGLSCTGGHCDDVAVLCDPAAGILTDKGDWVGEDRMFSEEGENKQTCQDGELMTGFRCTGDYCDNVEIKCSKVEGFQRNRCEWSDVGIKSGPFDTERRYWAPEDYFVAGLSCHGSYCSEMKAFLCSASSDVHPDELPRPYLTGLTFAGKPPAECSNGGVAIGLAAEYGYSGRIELVCDTRVETTTSQKWLEDRFSEEESPAGNFQVCPGDSLVTGISCDGKNCDNMKLRCSKAPDYNHEEKSCFWSDKVMSDVGVGKYGMFYFDEDFAIAGLKCEGRYCDNMNAYLCPKPKPKRSTIIPDVAPEEPVITEEPVGIGDEGPDDQTVTPVTWTVRFESVDPAESLSFLVDVLGMKKLDSESDESSLLTYGSESTNVEIAPISSQQDAQRLKQMIDESDENRQNFSSWIASHTGLWVADLSPYIDRLIGSSVNFIGPVLRTDGVYQLFIKVPSMGYVELATLTLPDDQHLDMLKDWDEIWGEIGDMSASQIATRGVAYGGDQGLVFDTLEQTVGNDEIAEISVTGADFVSSITVSYKSGKTVTVGNDQVDGTTDSLMLSEGERLIDGTVCRGSRVGASGSNDGVMAVSHVGFSTSFGRHFYVGNHTPNGAESDCIWLNVPEGEHVVGIYGRDDDLGIVKFGFVFRPIPESK